MIFKRGLLILLVIPFFIISKTAFANATLEDLKEKAKVENLSQDPFWLKLLRFESPFMGVLSKRSAIKSSTYFLSAEGRFNSSLELLSTIDGFFQTINENEIDQHAICRFPARYKWLKKKLQWQGRDDILSKCIKYKKWMADGKIKSISLFFAAGYFGNPASYFGHSLIRFNTENSSDELMDKAINYGALTPESENPVVYVLKGLFGGYDAAYSDLHFFYHSHNYSETELRDLWEYRLNLNQEEVDFLVDHTWELLGQKFSYKFLSDNCASRVAELLEMVLITPLTPKNPLYTIPITVFEGLGNKKRPDGRPLVTEIRRVPSRQTRMSEKYLSLTSEQQKLSKSIIDQHQTLFHPLYLEQTNENKIKSLEFLMEYYSFRLVSEKTNQDLKNQRRDIILERIKLPVLPVAPQLVSVELAPHEGQSNFMLRTSYLSNSILGNGFELTLRPALYDLLTPNVARPENTGLLVGDTRLRFINDKFSLQQLEFFQVNSLSTPRTELEGNKSFAWQVRLGFYPQTLTCIDCLIGRLSGGVGLSEKLLPHLTFYGLIGGVAQSELNDFGTIALKPEFGVLMNLTNYWRVHMNVGYKKFFNGRKLENMTYKIENRFVNSRYWDFRVSYLQDIESESSASVAWFY